MPFMFLRHDIARAGQNNKIVQLQSTEWVLILRIAKWNRVSKGDKAALN